MIDITSAYEKVKDLTGDVDILPLDQAVLEQRPGLQHNEFAAAWEDQITDFGARDPISAFPASCMQRVQSQAGSGAMFWLTHVPHSQADRMSTTEIRTALQYALGLDLDILKGVRRCYRPYGGTERPPLYGDRMRCAQWQDRHGQLEAAATQRQSGT